MTEIKYSSKKEARKILDSLCQSAEALKLPATVVEVAKETNFTAERDFPYFPIPFKETETAAALKAIEGSLASALARVKYGLDKAPQVTVDLEKCTGFLFQAYLSTVGGYGKFDKETKSLLKGLGGPEQKTGCSHH